MNRNMLSVLTVAAAALCLIGAGRDGGGGNGDSHGGRGGGGGHRSAPAPSVSHAPSSRAPSSTIYRQQRVTVPRASMPAPEHTIHDQNRAVYPQRSEAAHEGAGRITQRAAAAPPAHHLAVVQNTNVVRNIQTQQRTEVVPNRYYWHNDHGMRYSHYYDGRNHWYGFYHGPSFYWTRYYGDRWWWFDGPHARWVFWWDGFWWWPGVGGVPYVYVDNNYYPYEGTGVTVEQAEEQPAPATIPAPNEGKPVVSPDSRRMVQMGTDGQAFLYDNTAKPPTFLKYLGQGVTQVRFSGGTAATPSQILVEYKDNTFALFDADGNSQSSALKTEEATTPAPPETPDSIPPPPTSVPGQ